jgi:hypothetical protein
MIALQESYRMARLGVAGRHGSLCKPLDTADKPISGVPSATALGPQPSADFGPFDGFVEHS